MKYRAYKNKFWNEKQGRKILQILSFYNVLKNQKLSIYQT